MPSITSGRQINIATGMADSTEACGHIPPGVPVAHLQSIDLALLRNGDNYEVQRLLEGCRERGIFYLNLESEEEELSPIVTALYRLTRELYDLPLEEKLTYDVDKLYRFKCNGHDSLISRHDVPD